jgi:hypothetical protein
MQDFKVPGTLHGHVGDGRHFSRAAVLRLKREESCLGQWISGLETRAARNVVIVATANSWPGSVRQCCRAETTIGRCTAPLSAPIRRSDLKLASQKSAEERRQGGKHSQTTSGQEYPNVSLAFSFVDAVTAVAAKQIGGH